MNSLPALCCSKLWRLTASCAGILLLLSGRAPTAHAEDEKLVPLHAWWAASTEDNRTTSDPSWIGLPGEARGIYGFHRVMGWIYSPALPQPAGTVPLYAWYHEGRGDHLLSSQPYWAESVADTMRDGYRFLRLEGYVPSAPTGRATTPLNSWWNPSRADNYATTMPEWSGGSGTSREGYTFYRREGYVFPPDARSELKRFNLNQGLPSVSGKPEKFRYQNLSMHCQTFAATAALEAAYSRKYGGNWDLSEELLGFLGKTNWLNHDVALPMSSAQNQVGLYGGGGGTGMLKIMRDGLRTTGENAAMPYTPMWMQKVTDEKGRFVDATGFYDELGVHREQVSQEFVNAVNFGASRIDGDPMSRPMGVRLPQAMLEQPEYYGAQTMAVICERGNPDVRPCADIVPTSDVEAVLRSGREVIYDISSGAHVMLIVGYDRTDSDPSKHFFLAKDSYGFDASGEEGFVKESYAKVRGASALGYIDTVRPKAAWPELKHFGRWNLVFDGHRAELVVHRVPGSFDEVFEDLGVPGGERRLGTFTDSTNKLFRINGALTSQRLEFNVDTENPSLSFTSNAGRRFTMYMSGRDTSLTAGWFRGDDGIPFSAYAIKGTPLTGRSSTLTGGARWIGTWDVRVDGRVDTMVVRAVSGSSASVSYTLAGATTTTIATLDANTVLTVIPNASTVLQFRELNHNGGVAAGTLSVGSAWANNQGVVLTRR